MNAFDAEQPEEHASLQPLATSQARLRRRLSTKDELLLALLPTAMVLAVLFLVEILSRQRLLFASLASSAFLIYLDPQHGTNTLKTLTASHLLAAVIGALVCGWLGEGYAAAGVAMLITITTIIALDVVHPPAISTSLGFAFRAENTSGFLLFVLALCIIAALVGLQRTLLWFLAVLAKRRPAP